jgi:CheY-like chemotaxis protein
MKNKVLIVDDDPNNIFALSAVLRSRGWEVESVITAEDGIKILKSDGRIGIVLLDMMMPDTDGYEMIHQIRKVKGGENLPVIAVTAQAMMGDREKCLAAGANDYVSKPIDADRLLAILSNTLKQV